MRGRKPHNPALLEFHQVRPGGKRQKFVHSMPRLSPEPGPALVGPERELFADIVSSAPPGLLAEIDRTLLQVFAQHAVIHQRAVRELQDLTMETDDGPRKHPLGVIATEQARLLLPLAVELGLTATARQRIRLPAADTSGWDDIAGA
jgi:hypothetical protein